MAARDTQQPVEVLLQPDTGNARVTQTAAEVLILPNVQARATQIIVETLIKLPRRGSRGVIIE